jgi:hypothetical protein
MTIDTSPAALLRLSETAEEYAYGARQEALDALADHHFEVVAVLDALAERAAPALARKFALGDRVTKTKGSAWTGRVVGFYATSLTPIGYAVESENEPGSVQIYPEAALAAKGGTND